MKNHFPSEPVKDNGANTRHDDHNQPEKFPERGKFFPTCKNWEGIEFFWKLKVSELFELFKRFTYEVPSIETGLLGELNPMFL